ncbi:heptaprenyl diphosphate synthase component 1 [Peribacillus huizhouensis]|uniref:Heptaprenyl diphosphate synthase n=1 Tax=Peribacillus huizhouensis TaxID=1501239 RepID=A0ABR6CS10_9BACI|nr:heptaprenyl diphosphate synthase component 1 [Peribacillus huizhouensis]MBA9027813.1 heptaprenyl diphosphate synthase [Peribacillus huizhouensis]
MLNIDDLLIELKESTESTAYHPYLLKYLDKPNIDFDKILLLWGMFNELEIQKQERNTYILATLLVQSALDTHELVTNTNENDNSKNGRMLKDRQLTVLAGDYYSGLYYQLLANSNNIQLISIISNAIKEINEHKIMLYQKTITNEAELMRSIQVIESSLIGKVADYLNMPFWKEISGALLLLKRLHSEKLNYLESGESIVVRAIQSIDTHNNPLPTNPGGESKRIVDIIDQHILQVHQSVERTVQLFSSLNKSVNDRIHHILEETAAHTNTFVEEG